MNPTDPTYGSHKPRTPFTIPARAAKRALANYTKDINGCHISNYSVGSHGYAQIGWHTAGEPRRATTAHRAAWVAETGKQIPPGMTIDHTCKNRHCVNPKHLRMMSNFENGRRTHGRDWEVGTCANGHPNSELTDGVWRKDKRGNQRVGKRCRQCYQLYSRRASWRRFHPGDPYPESLAIASEKHGERVAA